MSVAPQQTGKAAKGTFRSFRNHNFRLWAIGALVSNVGTWMQRTAQDWLVLTELTDHNATALGIVMGLQFGAQLVLLPIAGWAADRFDKRKLLIVTQSTMGVLALLLGLLTVTKNVTLWQVYLFAGLLGTASAIDAPTRQTFVSELVGEKDLSNAVALNSSSFNLARMLGPAAAGALIAAVGTGWAFILNALTFAAVLTSLLNLRVGELFGTRRVSRDRAGMMHGFRYLWQRPDLKTLLFMLAVMGMLGLNFPIFISTMAVMVFHQDAGGYGMLSSMMAAGSVTGALLAARREKPRLSIILTATGVFGVGVALAALMPSYWLFGMSLYLIGVAGHTFLTSVNGAVQMGTDPAMRGRIMAIHMAIAMGGTPIGAPLVGFVADHFGARWAVSVGAFAGISALLIGLRFRARHPEGLQRPQH